VVPGVTAATAAAALAGSPLGHDHCAISLSDLLTPWEAIRARVEAAAAADFVLALYNPASRTRSWQLGAVAGRLLALRAAATPIGLTYIYWPICEQFLQRHPRVDLAFQDVELPADGPRLVRTGAVDVAFSALPLPGTLSQLNVVRLGSVESVLFAHPEHPLVAEQPVAPQRLRDQRVVLYRRRTDAREFATQTWLDELGGTPRPLETGDVEYLKRLVRLGRGLSVLPWPAVEPEVTSGALARVLVQAPGLFQEFGLVHGSGHVPRAVRVLADFCRSLPFSALHAA
jgi:DNA-binding transcriptional LysR family regulator